MKKLLILLLSISLFSCSSDSDSGDVGATSNGSITINNEKTTLQNAFVARRLIDEKSLFTLFITDGTITYENNGWVFGNDITRIITFELLNKPQNTLELNYLYKHDNTSFFSLGAVSFKKDVVVDNGEFVDYNQVFTQEQIVLNNGSLFIDPTNDGKHILNFNFTLTTGNVKGDFKGVLKKLNY